MDVEKVIKTSDRGIDLIKAFEGFRAKSYQCSASVWTIGWGSTRLADGSRVTQNTPEMSRDEAESLLRKQLVSYEQAVLRLVPCKLTQSQFESLVSFAYNLGSGSLRASTLRKKVIKGDPTAPDEFPRWSYASGKFIRGLHRRRMAERNLFLSS
jgi:GH24 family phage-related lysozyme (muramidase)